jgi:hypothetical protein
VTEDWQLPAPSFASEASSAGVRFGVDDHAFSRWWKSIPREDQQEFLGIHGGDELLARFVFAFDHLTTIKREPASNSVIVLAYMQAARLHDDEIMRAQKLATRAWDHDAVQQLIYRLRDRSQQQAAARISNQAAYLIETLTSQALNEEFMLEVKDKTEIAKTAIAFLKLVQTGQTAELAERSKRGALLAAKQLAEAKANDTEQITPESATLHMRMLYDSLGQEWLHNTLKQLEPVKGTE